MYREIRVLRSGNPAPEMGRVPGEEEVVVGEGNQMIPLVWFWKGEHSAKRSWGWPLEIRK